MDKIKIIGAAIMLVGLGLIAAGIIIRIGQGPDMVVYGNILGGFCLTITGAIFSFVD